MLLQDASFSAKLPKAAPYEFEAERDRKVPRARHALARLPALP